MTNRYKLELDSTVTIALNGGYATHIDLVDLSLVDLFPNTWTAIWSPSSQTHYVVGSWPTYLQKISRDVRLHTWILDLVDSTLEVDHLDHNGLNNSRSNIRAVTRSINLHNRRKSLWVTSPYKNVHWHAQNKSWRVQIKIDGKCISYSLFKDVEEAHRVAQDARERLGLTPEDLIGVGKPWRLRKGHHDAEVGE